MSRVCMLSTIDNPFDPFDSFKNWSQYDHDNDNNSGELLARLTYLSDQLTDDEYNEEIERVIDNIVTTDPFNKYIKVIKGTRIPSK